MLRKRRKGSRVACVSTDHSHHEARSLSRARELPTNITEHESKCGSELCRNRVRSPRNGQQIRTFKGSDREAFCSGKSLNRLRVEVFRYHSGSVAGFDFQACSFNHSDISPYLESTSCELPQTAVTFTRDSLTGFEAVLHGLRAVAGAR